MEYKCLTTWYSVKFQVQLEHVIYVFVLRCCVLVPYRTRPLLQVIRELIYIKFGNGICAKICRMTK